MLVTTTERIPGQEYEVLGECFGVTTQSRDIISNFGAGLKNLVGGEIKGYTKMPLAKVERSRWPQRPEPRGRRNDGRPARRL